MPRFKVRDSDDKGEPVPFTADDLAQLVFPDMVVELQSLDSFSGFAKGTRKPQKLKKSQPSDQNSVASPPGAIDFWHIRKYIDIYICTYMYVCLLNGVYIYIYIYTF